MRTVMPLIIHNLFSYFSLSFSFIIFSVILGTWVAKYSASHSMCVKKCFIFWFALVRFNFYSIFFCISLSHTIFFSLFCVVQIFFSPDLLFSLMSVAGFSSWGRLCVSEQVECGNERDTHAGIEHKRAQVTTANCVGDKKGSENRFKY